MKALRLVLLLLLAALFIAPLVCVNSSLFHSAKLEHSRGLNPQMYTNSKDRPLDLDIAKCFYLPEEWVTWYRLSAVGCTSMTEEDMEGSGWLMAYDTDIVREDGRLVMATTTDYTVIPSVSRRAEFTYGINTPSQPETITISYLLDNQWTYVYQQTYSYNVYGGLTHLSVDRYFPGAGWYAIEDAYCESTMDRLTQVTILVYDFDQSIWVNSKHIALSWTGSQVNEVIEQDWTYIAWQNGGRTIFSYNAEADLNQVTGYDWNTTSGLWVGNERSTFTINNELWSEELIEDYSSTLGWQAGWKGIMSYNNAGYPVNQLGYEWQNENWVLSERMSFYYDGSAVQDDSTPGAQLVISNYPNPFVGVTTVSYKLPHSAQTELSIYNIRGQMVRRLVNEPLFSGQHTVTWDGKDDNGKALPSGMYLCRISSAGKQETHKMLLMK